MDEEISMRDKEKKRLYDIAYLHCLPNVIAMAPKDEDELADMMFTATQNPHPTLTTRSAYSS